MIRYLASSHNSHNHNFIRLLLFYFYVFLKLARGVVCVVKVGYVVNHHCLKFVKGVVMVGYIINHHCLKFVKGVVMVGYIINHHCLKFVKGVVNPLWLVMWSTITFQGLPEEWLKLLQFDILSTITL